MSARAAAQLEYLGFSDVFHYLRGKADWMLRGLPMEPAAPLSERLHALPYFISNLAPRLRAGWIRISGRATVSDLLRDDVARIGPGDPVPGGPSLGDSPLAVVLDANGILLGAVEQRMEATRAVDVMNPGPQTIRPDMTRALAAMLLKDNRYILITTARGRYLGCYAAPSGSEH
jgi:hypothetical protein